MESIEVNQHLHAKLHHKVSKVPLPGWFNSMNRCKKTSVGMLQNFVSHMHNIAADWPHNILAGIQKNIYLKGIKFHGYLISRFFSFDNSRVLNFAILSC